MNASGTIIAGNPSEPCIGKGVCDMNLTAMGSDLEVAVQFQTTGQDLTIVFSSLAMTQLLSINPEVYNDMVTNSQFLFDQFALPFYIPNAIRKELWGAGDPSSYVSLTAAAPVTVSSDEKGNYSVVIANISYGVANKQPTPVSVILNAATAISSGSWNIGNDYYGNLVITNGQNQVLFGAIGNMSIKRHAVLTSGPSSQPNAGITSASNILNVGAWNIGTDDSGDLVFNNGTNCIVFYGDGSNISINGQYAALEPSTNMACQNIVDTSSIYSLGNTWQIGCDSQNNLCLGVNGTSMFHFDTTGNVYVGTNAVSAQQIVNKRKEDTGDLV